MRTRARLQLNTIATGAAENSMPMAAVETAEVSHHSCRGNDGNLVLQRYPINQA